MYITLYGCDSRDCQCVIHEIRETSTMTLIGTLIPVQMYELSPPVALLRHRFICASTQSGFPFPNPVEYPPWFNSIPTTRQTGLSYSNVCCNSISYFYTVVKHHRIGSFHIPEQKKCLFQFFFLYALLASFYQTFYCKRFFKRRSPLG